MEFLLPPFCNQADLVADSFTVDMETFLCFKLSASSTVTRWVTALFSATRGNSDTRAKVSDHQMVAPFAADGSTSFVNHIVIAPAGQSKPKWPCSKFCPETASYRWRDAESCRSLHTFHHCRYGNQEEGSPKKVSDLTIPPLGSLSFCMQLLIN